jgi:hypothetical protein
MRRIDSTPARAADSPSNRCRPWQPPESVRRCIRTPQFPDGIFSHAENPRSGGRDRRHSGLRGLRRPTARPRLRLWPVLRSALPLLRRTLLRRAVVRRTWRRIGLWRPLGRTWALGSRPRLARRASRMGRRARLARGRRWWTLRRRGTSRWSDRTCQPERVRPRLSVVPPASADRRSRPAVQRHAAAA